MMEQRHNGHEGSPMKRQTLGEVRASLEDARSYLERLERETPGAEEAEAETRPRSKGRLAALAAAAVLDLLVRRLSGPEERPRPRRRTPGLFKLAVLSAAALAIGKLIAAKR